MILSALALFFIHASEARSSHLKYLDLSIITLPETKWTNEDVNKFLINSETALIKCNILIDRIEIRDSLRTKKEPNESQSMISNSNYYINILEQESPLYRPAIILTQNQGPAVGVAIGKDYVDWVFTKNDPQKEKIKNLENSIWIKQGFWLEASKKYDIFSHELGHLMGLQHRDDPNDIMYPDTNESESATFSRSQCSQMRKTKWLKKKPN